MVTKLMRAGLKYDETIFNYTRGRFVCNEEYEMSQSRTRINVNELSRVAAEATGSKSCIDIRKCPDGMYNRVLLLTMDDNKQVVAKIPNPNAGKPHYTTSSEVATMDFARNVLDTPVPKVLAWSSTDKNSVGAEYIIMDKVHGIELEHVWPRMGIEAKFAVVKAIAGFQKAWTSISFKKFGSLYYTTDLGQSSNNEVLYFDVNGAGIVDSKFAIGPCTGREYFDDGRGAVEFSRGPWETLEDYQAAIGLREATCVHQMSRLPKSPITICGPGTYIPTRERKLQALRCYSALIKHVTPTNRSITSSHLWHGDLHAGNIFVNPSKPTEVLGVIDWQSSELAPLFYQARQPHLIDYEGPQVLGLDKPQPPKDDVSWGSNEKQYAEALYLNQSLCVLYNTLTHGRNPSLYAALEYQQTTDYFLLLLARNLLIDGEAAYLLEVARLQDEWSLRFGDLSTYPFSFSAVELKEFETQKASATLAMHVMRSIKATIGDLFPEQGVVRPEKYDESLNALQQMKEQVIAMFAHNEQERLQWEEYWPFEP